MIIIRTAPRPGGVDYLPGIIEACDREGFFEGLIVSDGGAVAPASVGGWGSWTWYRPKDHPIGSREAGWAMLRQLCRYETDALVLEDDARPVPGAVKLMHEMAVLPGAAFLSFFSYSAIHRHMKLEGFHDLPTAGIVPGSVALKVPVATARAVLEKFPVPPSYGGRLVQRHGFDAAFGLACAEVGLGRFLLYQPSLVEHVGDVSIVSERRHSKRAAWLAGSEPPTSGNR